MTSFEQLLGHLRAVLGQPDPDAGRAARVWFRGFKRERYASLPRTPLEALGREETALYSLRADPFGGELFALAAAVAESAGGDPGPFRAQHSRYQARFGRARAGAGLGRVLGDPQFLEMFENVADAPASSPLTVPHSPPEGSFVSFAGGEDELPRSYPSHAPRTLPSRPPLSSI